MHRISHRSLLLVAYCALHMHLPNQSASVHVIYEPIGTSVLFLCSYSFQQITFEMNPVSVDAIKLSVDGNAPHTDSSLLAIQSGSLTVGVGWEVSDGIDLDVSAVCFSSTGSVLDAAYYNELSIFGGSITHSGDSKKGEKQGFDEEIVVSLDGLPAVSAVLFFLSAYSGGTFKNCESAMIEVRTDNKPLCTFTASGPATGSSTGLMMAMLYRDVNTRAWHFKKIMDPCVGRHFAACLMPMRSHVDRVLDPGAVGERQLSHDKTFKMEKGDQMKIPAGVSKLTVGLGWTAAGGLDLDASCLYLDDIDNDGDLDPVDAVFFGQKEKQGARSTGDNTSGAGEGDDEQIQLDLSAIPSSVTSLAFIVTIYTYNGSFSQVSDSYVRLFDSATNHEYARFKLDATLKKNAVVFAMLSRESAHNRNQWLLLTLGQECSGQTVSDVSTPLWDGKWDRQEKYPVRSNAVDGGGGDNDECCVIN